MVTYVILNTSEITDENSTIDFSQLLNRSERMLRYSTDRSKALVKYAGSKPTFLDGKTTYTDSEIKSVLYDTEGEWYQEA